MSNVIAQIDLWLPGGTAFRVAFAISATLALLALLVQFSPRALKYLWVAIKQLASDILLFAPGWLKAYFPRSEWLQGSVWETREQRWRDHIATYLNLKRMAELKRLAAAAAAAIKEAQAHPEDVQKQTDAQNARAALDSAGSGWGAERIHYLSSDRLSILTPKFSTVLTFQSLTLVAMSITMGTFWKDADAALRRELWWMLGALASPWCITVMACLIANGNVYWGDLWRPSTRHHSSDKTDLEGREDEYANLLIGVLILRSAVLRVMTFVAIVTFFLAVFVIVYVLRTAPLPNKTVDDHQPPPGPRVDAGPLPAPARYVFASGESCTDATKTWAEKLATSVAATEGLKVRASTSADTRPLRAQMRQQYGNDVGLAFDRARCLEKLVTGAFEQQGMKLEMAVAVRNITSKTIPMELDRTAIVEWFHTATP